MRYTGDRDPGHHLDDLDRPACACPACATDAARHLVAESYYDPDNRPRSRDGEVDAGKSSTCRPGQRRVFTDQHGSTARP